MFHSHVLLGVKFLFLADAAKVVELIIMKTFSSFIRINKMETCAFVLFLVLGDYASIRPPSFRSGNFNCHRKKNKRKGGSD